MRIRKTDGTIISGTADELIQYSTATGEMLLAEGTTDEIVWPEDFIKKPTRADVVAKAKRDIDDFKSASNIEGIEGYPVANPEGDRVCNVDFVVNREKRTVVALMKGVKFGHIYARGIARCEATDVFNAHIGKAIALRRALGLSVPDAYLDAPKPKGVRAGDVIVKFIGGTPHDVVYRKSPDRPFEHTCAVDSMFAEHSIVIDDTDREEYGGDAD